MNKKHKGIICSCSHFSEEAKQEANSGLINAHNPRDSGDIKEQLLAQTGGLGAPPGKVMVDWSVEKQHRDRGTVGSKALSREQRHPQDL